MKHEITKKWRVLTSILAMTLIGVMFSTSAALADMAAGVSISNIANVDWAENTGAAVPSNAVVVTVNLVPNLAWDDGSLAPSYEQTIVPGAGVSYTMDLLNLSNGSATVTLNDDTPTPGTNLNNDANFTATPTTTVPANDLTLVGTVASGPATDTGGGTWTIPVYNLDTADLNVGITRIHINGVTGTYYVVAAGSDATNLVITSAGDPGVVVGDQIGEVLEITYAGTVATLPDTSLVGIHDHALTAASGTASDQISSDGNDGAGNDWRTLVAVSDLTITKYVRNDTAAVVGATTPTDDGFGTYGTSYYRSGVTGDPGDVLEYLIIVSNGGSGVATDVVVTDAIPTTYVNLDQATVDIDTNGDGTFNLTDAILTNDAASYAAPNLTVYAGVGGTFVGPPATTGGTVAAGATTAIIFQVQIK